MRKEINLEIIKDLFLNKDVRSFNETYGFNFKAVQSIARHGEHTSFYLVNNDSFAEDDFFPALSIRVDNKTLLDALTGLYNYVASVNIEEVLTRTYSSDLIRAMFENNLEKIQKVFISFDVKEIKTYNEDDNMFVVYIKGDNVSIQLKFNGVDIIDTVGGNRRLAVAKTASLWF